MCFQPRMHIIETYRIRLECVTSCHFWRVAWQDDASLEVFLMRSKPRAGSTVYWDVRRVRYPTDLVNNQARTTQRRLRLWLNAPRRGPQLPEPHWQHKKSLPHCSGCCIERPPRKNRRARQLSMEQRFKSVPNMIV